MLQSDGQWQDHKNDVHIEDYKKEISKEVKDFSKEVPAIILKMHKTHWKICSSDNDKYSIRKFSTLTIKHQYLVIGPSL